MDLKRSTGKSFPSVHISDMHKIRMYRNTRYYTTQQKAVNDAIIQNQSNHSEQSSFNSAVLVCKYLNIYILQKKQIENTGWDIAV